MPVFLLFAGVEDSSEGCSDNVRRRAFLRWGGRWWAGVCVRRTGGIVGGDESWVRSTYPLESPSSLSGQGESNLSESKSGLSEEKEKLSNGGGDARRGEVLVRDGRGGVGIRGGLGVDDGGGGRPEELEGPPVGSVARGKLGKSKCERFLSNGAEP